LFDGVEFERVVVVYEKNFIAGGAIEETRDVIGLSERRLVFGVDHARLIKLRRADKRLGSRIAGIVADQDLNV
jgi:hypothetical protein